LNFSSPIGAFYRTLVYFEVLWYTYSHFGMSQQIKSGNPVPAFKVFLAVDTHSALNCNLYSKDVNEITQMFVELIFEGSRSERNYLYAKTEIFSRASVDGWDGLADKLALRIGEKPFKIVCGWRHPEKKVTKSSQQSIIHKSLKMINMKPFQEIKFRTVNYKHYKPVVLGCTYTSSTLTK
jgi:hypothetical protein